MRQTDYDGKTETFNIETVYFENASETIVHLYPNPSDGTELIVELKGFEIGNCRLEVFSQQMKLIKVHELMLYEENNKLNIAEGLGLVAGIYYLRVTGIEDSHTRMFTIK